MGRGATSLFLIDGSIVDCIYRLFQFLVELLIRLVDVQV